MQFGIIGNHPDGLAMAQALAKSHHELAGYAGPPAGARWLDERGLACPAFRDPEELLARGNVELVIVADDLEHRPQMLRRAMQSEKHVLCVHPADVLPDVTYEMAMIQEDTRKAIISLLPERLSPAARRAKELLVGNAIGALEVIEGEWPLPIGGGKDWDGHPLARMWDVLRALAGEIQDVSALTHDVAALQPDAAVTVTGRFEQGGLFHQLVTPLATDAPVRLVVRGKQGRIELRGNPRGFTHLKFECGTETKEEAWSDWDPWQALVEAVRDLNPRATPRWQDATRCLELFEAARTSARKKRVVSMLYEDFSEAANFKGIMAAGGCLLIIFLTGVLVAMLLVGIPLYPWLAVVATPIVGLFLILQFLRWIVPNEPKTATPPKEPPAFNPEPTATAASVREGPGVLKEDEISAIPRA